MTADTERGALELIREAEGLERCEDWSQAAELYKGALTYLPLESQLWHRTGMCLRRSGSPDQALDYLEKASVLSPEDVAIKMDLGDTQVELRMLGEAIQTYLKVQKLEPENISAHNNLAIALQQGRLFDDAAAALKRTLQIAPDDPVVMGNYGSALLKTGQIRQAIDQFEQALAIAPDLSEVWSNYGVALQEEHRMDAALDAHRKAVALAPENHAIHYNNAMSFLLYGRFEEGFTAFEHRLEMPDRKPREFGGIRWTGEDLAGKKILVHAEQGVGDCIQFARFLPLLNEMGAQVIFASHSSLLRLFTTLGGIQELIGPDQKPSDFDFQTPLLSLALRLDPNLERLASLSNPYLKVPGGTECPLGEKGARMRVGLVWAGNPLHANDRNRSCPFEQLHPLFDLPHIQWVNLQVGERSREFSTVPAGNLDISASLKDFAATAAAISNLDLLISVDTSVLHLAGALGVRAWALLSYAPDWRWMLERRDSPWYPTLTLYRQKQPGDWAALVANIKADLALMDQANPGN